MPLSLVLSESPISRIKLFEKHSSLNYISVTRVCDKNKNKLNVFFIFAI